MNGTTLYADLTLMYLGRLVTVKGDAPGHPFRGNQYGEGQGGGLAGNDEPSFEDVYGDSADWKPERAAGYGHRMISNMGFGGSNIGESQDGLLSVTTDAAGVAKLSGVFSKVASSPFNTSTGKKHLAFVNASLKKNRKVIENYLREEYAKGDNEA